MFLQAELLINDAIHACVCMYVMVIVLNVRNMIHCVTVQGCGKCSDRPYIGIFSNKIIIFTHATDSALFIVFLTITHTLTKLKRLLTFDNFTVPFFFFFYGWAITVRVLVKR